MLLKKTIHLLFILCLTGCMHKSTTQQLADFIIDPDNKITQSIQVGNSRIVAKFLPSAYRNPNNALPEPVEDDYIYFNVKIERHNATEDIPKDKLLYLNFDIQGDFTLLQGSDSIAPTICQRIENGTARTYEYLLAFDNSRKVKDFTLFYEDNLFGIGTVAFVYKQEDLSKIPFLKTLASNEAHP